MSLRETKNYGQIKAIHPGVNPPLNIKMLWYDENPGQKIHKYYDVGLAEWRPLKGGDTGEAEGGTFTYIAFATDCDGTDFTLTKQPESTHQAIISSVDEIPVAELIPGLFSGLWIEFCGEGEVDTGNFTYVRYANDKDGDNLSESPIYEVPCGECTYADVMDPVNQNGLFTIEEVATDEFRITFNNIIYGSYLELELKKAGSSIPSFTNQYIQITQDAEFTGGDGNEGFLINTDPNSEENYLYLDSPGVQTDIIKQMVGSKIRFSVPSTVGAAFSGSINIKIGNESCATPPTGTCYACREFMAIIVSDVKLTEQQLADTGIYSGFWIPVGGCGGGGTNQQSIDNLNVQIENLRNVLEQHVASLKESVDTVNTDLETHEQTNITKFEEIDLGLLTLQQNLTSLTDDNTIRFDGIDQKIVDNTGRIEAVEQQLTPQDLIILLTPEIETMLAAFREEAVKPLEDGLTITNSNLTALQEKVDLYHPE